MLTHYQYRNLRTHAMEGLAAKIKQGPQYGDMQRLHIKLGCPTLRLKEEQDQAMAIWEHCDLTSKERAAAHLLAVISNHRAISWWREPQTPDGTPPLPALEPWQEKRLRAQTREAIGAYALALPEREAAALLIYASEIGGVVKEGAEQRQARRWQMCIDAGLTMPQDTYAHLPRGINEIAKAEGGITRQALAEDLNRHRERLFGK